MNIVRRITSGQGLISAFVVVVVLGFTLLPSGNSPPLPFSFSFGGERRWLADGILNICLFVPVGLAIGWNSRSPFKAIGVGMLLSVAIELAQTMVPGRDPSLSDIVFNSFGAVLGALIGRRPQVWIFPDAKNSAALTTLSILAVALVMTATALVLRDPSHANALGLDEPMYGSNQVFSGPTVGQGWALLEYPDALALRWGTLVSGLWMSILCVPVGFWSRDRLRFIAAIALISLMLAIPALTGIVSTSSIEWVGAAVGFITGLSLRWLAGRRARAT
ncbi:MAG TPA: VanZ family protein [Gemmatimonadaceae bacterium]